MHGTCLCGDPLPGVPVNNPLVVTWNLTCLLEWTIFHHTVFAYTQEPQTHNEKAWSCHVIQWSTHNMLLVPRTCTFLLWACDTNGLCVCAVWMTVRMNVIVHVHVQRMKYITLCILSAYSLLWLAYLTFLWFSLISKHSVFYSLAHKQNMKKDRALRNAIIIMLDYCECWQCSACGVNW